jgi:hypothetical protein
MDLIGRSDAAGWFKHCGYQAPANRSALSVFLAPQLRQERLHDFQRLAHPPIAEHLPHMAMRLMSAA